MTKAVKLQEGEACKLKILSGERFVLSVPNEAIQKIGDLHFVYVSRNLREFERRSVIIGQSMNGQSEILGGLRLGEEVVVKGASALQQQSSKRQ